MSFDFLPAEISGLYLGKFVSPDPSTPSPSPFTLLRRQMSGTSGAKRLWVDSCLLTLHRLEDARGSAALCCRNKNIQARGAWRRMKDWGGRGAPRPLIKERPLQTAPIPPYT